MPPHIAFITVGDPQRLTGGYLYHARLFAGLRARGWRIAEIVASAADLAAQRAAVEQIGPAIDARRYDAVVIDALARGVVAPLADRWRAMRPVVVLVHQLPSVAEATPAQIAGERALEQPLLAADRLIAVSAHGRDTLIARGVAPERIVIVSPGFDRLPIDVTLEPIAPRANEIQALCVAQWLPRKGITTLIEAWIRGGWPDARLTLIGETDADARYAAEVRALIDAAPHSTIEVRGPVADAELQHAYRRADLFVLPSRFEGYGMVYAEALAHRLPIVACAVGPLPTLITERAGLLVPPDDPDALHEALARLIGDDRLRAELSRGAAERARTLPGWDDTVAGFARTVEDAIAARG